MHEIKRASLERDFMHRPFADGVINIHTARHKSSTQHKHTFKRHPLPQHTVRLTFSPSSAQPPDECSPAALHSGCGYVCFDGVKQNFS